MVQTFTLDHCFYFDTLPVDLDFKQKLLSQFLCISHQMLQAITPPINYVCVIRQFSFKLYGLTQTIFHANCHQHKPSKFSTKGYACTANYDVITNVLLKGNTKRGSITLYRFSQSNQTIDYVIQYVQYLANTLTSIRGEVPQ